MGDLTRDAQEAHPLTVSVEANKMKALDLRGEGKSYAKIADALGISKTRAHELVLEGLDELMVQSAESAEQVRILELGRLDDMLDRMLVKLSLQRREMATKDGQKEDDEAGGGRRERWRDSSRWERHWTSEGARYHG